MTTGSRYLLLGLTLVCMYVSATAARGLAAATPPIKATLTVTVTGSGTVAGGGMSCSGSCSQVFAAGQTITLTAAPASGSTFGGWGGDCAGAGSTTCVVVMNGAKNVTATFNKGSSGTPPPPAPVCTAHLASRDVLLKAPRHHPSAVKPSVGTVRLKLKCDQSTSGTLRLVVTETLSKGHMRTFTVARTVHLAARHAKQLTVKLPAGALTGLKKGRRESLGGALSVRNANGTDKAKLKSARLVGRG